MPALRCLIRRWRALESWIAAEAVESPHSRFPFTPLRDLVSPRREAVTPPSDTFGDWTPITVHLNGEISARERTVPYKGSMFAAYPGDVVFSKIDARNGAIGVLQEGITKAVVTPEFPVFVPLPERLDGGFVKLVLRTGNFLAALRLKASGTSGRKRITPDAFADLRVPLPPLNEQRAMVAAHRAALARAADLECEAAEVEVRAMEAFEAALGFSPPAPPPERPVFIASFKDLDRWSHGGILRRIVEGGTAQASPYSVVQLRDVIADLENGWSPKCYDRPAGPDEWGVLKLGAVSFAVFNPEENKALPKHFDPRPHLEVKPGELLISRANITRLVGAVALIDKTRPKLMLCDKIFRAVSRKPSPIDTAFLASGRASHLGRSATGCSKRDGHLADDEEHLETRLDEPHLSPSTQIRASCHGQGTC